MVIPSNDAFLSSPGDPTAIALFDEEGNFNGPAEFVLTGANVLDAGTEVNTEEDAAFLNQAAPNTGIDENGVVALHPGFNGSIGNPDATPMNVLGGTTAAGSVVDPFFGDFTRNDGTAPEDLAGFTLSFVNADTGAPATIDDAAPPVLLADDEPLAVTPIHGLDGTPDDANPLNPKALVHALGVEVDAGTTLLAFEDKPGGGDLDFNDVLLTVSDAPLSTSEVSLLNGLVDPATGMA